VKLRVEVYPNIALLYVSGSVEPTDLNLLRAGVTRIAQISVSWLFIDASVAVMSQATAIGILDLRYSVEKLQIECVVPYSIPDGFRTLEGALSVCTTRAASNLREKIILVKKLDEVTDRFNVLQIRAEQYRKKDQTLESLTEENRQLKKLHEALSQGLKAGGASKSKAEPLQLKEDPAELKRLLDAKKAWIIWLKKNEILA
jgi:hypothetical protein